jgi:hypothetical protein
LNAGTVNALVIYAASDDCLLPTQQIGAVIARRVGAGRATARRRTLCRIPEGTIGAFVSEDAQTAYPIVGQIADFLEQDSLQLSKDRPRERIGREAENASIQQSVKQWYDNFGWLRNDSGSYNDTALFSQQSLTPHGAYELASHISLLPRLSGGDFVLDAAGGPIAHPEYLAYSWFYKYRVCLDMSLTALREAQAKLEGKGFCCMANICHLPFREEVFDGVVSGYTSSSQIV